MSGLSDTSTQPLASADTANATPTELSAAFIRTGAEAMSRADGRAAASWFAVPDGATAVDAAAPRNSRLVMRSPVARGRKVFQKRAAQRAGFGKVLRGLQV